MKLYTEEQVRRAIDLAINGINQYYTPIIDRLTPIELPSDEYIDEVFQPMTELNAFYKDGFINGAKWMRDKIQGGNK